MHNPALEVAAGRERNAFSGPDSRVGYVYHRLLAISDLVAIVLAASIAVFLANTFDRSPDLDGYVAALVVEERPTQD
mgnify:FL=1